MLRISIEQHEDGVSLVLEGRLDGPWVDELRTVCLECGSNEKNVALTIDLCGLTAMDTRGQHLLDELLQRGATLRCSDVMNQYLVEQMGSSAEFPEACRPCRRSPAPADLSAPATEAKLAS